MVAQYTILGQKVGSHVLAMITLGTTFGGAFLASRGGGKKTTQTPPINASTQDEADFIKKFVENAEAEEKKAKH